MNFRQSRVAGVIGLYSVVWVYAVSAAPLDSSITYQGQLLDGGTPHPGPTAQMTFRLYDAPTLGTLVGTIGPQSVPVADGLFKVVLDFGDGAFTDEARWLEIQVAATTLSPRQELTPAPFAHQTRGIVVDHTTGNVGVGTASPNADFQVSGDRIRLVDTTNAHLQIAHSGTNMWTWRADTAGNFDLARAGYDGSAFGASSTDVLTVLADGNVGIGTTAPGAELHVLANTASLRLQDDDDPSSSYMEIRDSQPTSMVLEKVTSTGGSTIDVNPRPLDGTSDATIRFFRATNTPTGIKSVQFLQGENNTAKSAQIGVDGADSFFQIHGGNVGIGTTGPARLLQVGSSSVTDTQGMIRLASRSGTGASNRVWDIGVPETDEVTTGAGYSFVIDDTQLGTDPEFMVEYGTGNVGIGTTEPSTDLEVSSNSTTLTGLSLTNTSAGGNEFLFQSVGSGVAGRVGNFELWRVGASVSSLAVQPDGDVGIGTNAPTADLHIMGDGVNDVSVKIGSPSVAQVQMGYSLATLGSYLAIKDASGSDVISLTGVDGRMRSKVVEITGADLAEKFPVKESVEPGMVVEIDPDQPGQLRLASGAYNRRVAGVVSGAGGLPAGAILGNLPGSEDHPPIAMTGRVWVHCDASYGAIAPGDLLTTAETPGHAMKVEDYPRAQGAVIGKAMTELREGCGMVLVLVNLQ